MIVDLFRMLIGSEVTLSCPERVPGVTKTVTILLTDVYETFECLILIGTELSKMVAGPVNSRRLSPDPYICGYLLSEWTFQP